MTAQPGDESPLAAGADAPLLAPGPGREYTGGSAPGRHVLIPAVGQRARRLVAPAAAAVLVLTADVLSKAWARRELADGPVSLGPLDLRLGFNPGVAFGLGAGLPTWLVLGFTGAAVAVLVVAAARLHPRSAAALVVGGGIANLLDRAGDGTVTDFLHVGWWPTFNLADSAITVGVLWLALTALRAGPRGADECRGGRAQCAQPNDLHGGQASSWLSASHTRPAPHPTRSRGARPGDVQRGCGVTAERKDQGLGPAEEHPDIDRDGSRSRRWRLPAAIVLLTIVLISVAGVARSLLVTSDAAAGSTALADQPVTEFPRDERGEPVDLAGTSLTGQPLDLADLRGRVVVVNVWGSWCAPCRTEAPVLAAAARDYADRGVRFVGVNVKDNRAAALAFEKTHGIPYPSIEDPAGRSLLTLTRYVPASAVPVTLVLDGEGRVAARVLGAVPEATLRALLDTALDETTRTGAA